MEAFVVLGIIPGINVQISFEDWLRGVAVLLSLLVIASFLRSRVPLVLLILWTLRAAKHDPMLATRLA